MSPPIFISFILSDLNTAQDIQLNGLTYKVALSGLNEMCNSGIINYITFESFYFNILTCCGCSSETMAHV